MQSSEFLINMKPSDIPLNENSIYYDDFWANERHKAEYGLTVNGVYVSGWLYWHTNLWTIYDDIEDPINFSIKRKSFKPSFRDNEWLIAEALEEAGKLRQGVMIFGSRRLGKSEFSSSYIGRGATLFEGTENVVMGGNWGDVDIIMNKVDYGLNNLPDYFKTSRIANDLRKKIELGYKDKKGNKNLWSQIITRNHDNGQNTESAAGLTPSTFIMDEVGKALKNGSIVYTDSGTKEIQNLKVGDYIYDNTGTLVKVLNVIPQPYRKLYKITLKDKRTINCSPEHLWTVWDTWYGKIVTKTTEELLESLYISNNKKRNRYFIYNTKPLLFENKNLTINPYVLGVWIGDGCKNTTSFASLDNEIVNIVNNIVKKDKLYVKSKGIDHNIISLKKSKTNYLKEQLKKYNILNNKRIPKDFLYSSFEQRLELLQGLMDTDGYCSNKNGNIQFCQTKNDLADDIEFLIRSLGIACYRKKKKTKAQETNVFTLFTDLPIFKLTRKLNNLLNKGNNLKSKSYKEKVAITKIEESNYDFSTCITISNNTGLFLTDNFIVTHNSPFISVFGAVKHSLTSRFGWRAIPILTGTSGDIKKNSDAQKYFENPDAFNFLVRVLKEEADKKVSVFISGFYRMEGKVDSTIGEFIENEKGILIPKNSELYQIPMSIKDDKKAEEVIDKEREIASKSPDPVELLKTIMYSPKNTKELFLTDDGNNFPIEALREHLYFLENNDIGIPARLYRDSTGKVHLSYDTNKKPINEFPLKDFAGYKKDACVIIYEPPIDNPPTYLYIAGGDPYNQSGSKWSSSLGSIFIYKRMYDPISGTFQDRIVAEYTARPETMKEFHETVEMLLELYNCVCMPENEASTFIQYFDLKNKSHLLADGYSFLKEIHPTTSIIGRTKGLPATTKVQQYYKELIYQYLIEDIIMDYTKDYEPIHKMGLVRIPSIGLIKELIAYADKGNFDRYVAFGHVLAHKVWADKIYPFIEQPKQEENTKQEENKQLKIKGPFDLSFGSNPFNVGSRNPFSL